MKRLFSFFTTVLLLTVFATALYAQTADIGESTVLNTPLSKIQLNSLTLYMIIRVVGQAYAALRAGGGLKGIYNALVYGENAPRAIMQDYSHELGLKKVDTPTKDGSPLDNQPR